MQKKREMQGQKRCSNKLEKSIAGIDISSIATTSITPVIFLAGVFEIYCFAVIEKVIQKSSYLRIPSVIT